MAWRNHSRRGRANTIAYCELLKGAKFRSFDAFRRRFWKAVANDPELSKQFPERSLRRMKKNGLAPIVHDGDIHLGSASFVLHHDAAHFGSQDCFAPRTTVEHRDWCRLPSANGR
ncbi:hypothetical protein ABFA30_07800 [Pseudomonas sp. HLMP]